MDTVQRVDLLATSELDVRTLGMLLAISPLHPFGKGDLTETGVQWSDAVTTTDGEWTEVENSLVDLGVEDEWTEMELALTLRLKSSGTSKFCKFKWQWKDFGGSWVDLHTEVTYAANAENYKEYTMSGRIPAASGVSKMKFYLRAVVQREDATENVTAQCKNSSYVAPLLV
jgi:hypothetical protein